MSQDSKIYSRELLVDHLTSVAASKALPLSTLQAASVAAHIDPPTLRGCERAVSYIQAFSTDTRLDDLPCSFWRSSTQAHQIAAIVLSYLIEGLSPLQRDVLWLSVLLKERTSHALFLRWLELDDVQLHVCVQELEQMGLLCQAKDEQIAQAVPVVLDWAERSMDWTLARAQELLRIHARHMLETFPAELVWESIFNSVAELDLARGLLKHRDELYALGRRIRGVDLELWSQLVCMVLVCDLFQGRATHLEVLGEQIIEHHWQVRDHVLASRLLMTWTRVSFPHTGQFEACLDLLKQAQQRVASVVDPRLRDRLELGVVLLHTFCHERMNIEVPRIAHELEATYTKYRTYEHIPEALQITTLRFMSRLQFALEHDERAERLAKQALERARQTQRQYLICVGLLEVAESCSRLGQREEFEALCNELLERCDVTCSPGFVHYVRLALGYAYFGAGKTQAASALFESSQLHFKESGERHNTQFMSMMLAAMALEGGHSERALVHLQGLAQGLDVTREDAVFAAPQLVLVVCAMLYAMCDELHLAQRVLHDAHAYKARCTETTYMSWGIDYVTAHLHVIQAILAPSQHGGLSAHTELLDVLRVQRQLVAQSDLFREGLLYFKQGLDRLMDTWLAAHGVSLKSPIQIHIDAWEPTWFAVNHLPRVSIKRRQAMRRLLTALLHQSRAPTSPPMTLEDMFAVGWPGEVASYESMQARVYNTISRMRKLGLDELIKHDGEGYQWNATCEVVIENESS